MDKQKITVVCNISSNRIISLMLCRSDTEIQEAYQKICEMAGENPRQTLSFNHQTLVMLNGTFTQIFPTIL